MLATAPSSSPSPSANPPSAHYSSTHSTNRRSSYRSASATTATIPPSPRTYSIRSTPSSSSSSKSNSSNPTAALPFRSPKRPTRDAGTQYSPLPDWQPTSTRASSGQPANPAPTQQQSHLQKAGAVTTPSSTTAQTILASQTQRPPQAHATEDAPEPVFAVESVRSSLNKSSGSSDVFLDSDRSSPSKRSRPDAPPPRVMPRNFADAEPKELANVIADMLMELIRVNDEIPLQDGQLTRFHSRAAPGISVKDYMARLTYHASLPTPILLSMITYIDRLCAAFPIFRINSLTVHRFLITSATVASKGLSDSFWTNGTYSKIGGVSIKELALLELELLSRVDWRIIPSAQELDDYYRNLVGRCEGYVLEEEGRASADGNSMDDDDDST